MDNLSTEQQRDIDFSEVSEIHRMVAELLRDIDAGKEPDGPRPNIYAEDRGRRMTLKRARARLHHVEVRLKTLRDRSQ